MIHELKTWIEYYQAVVIEQKDFEVRYNDRNFQVNDKLILREWDNDKKEYTGSYVVKTVKYILHGGQFGIEKGYCIMSFK